MKTRFYLTFVAMFLALTFIFSGCGGGDSGTISPYAGSYEGTYTGDDTGTWKVTVSLYGVVSGSLISSQIGYVTVSGAVRHTGELDAVAGGGGDNGSYFVGAIDADENVYGLWENPTTYQDGTFSGRKTGD